MPRTHTAFGRREPDPIARNLPAVTSSGPSSSAVVGGGGVVAREVARGTESAERIASERVAGAEETGVAGGPEFPEFPQDTTRPTAKIKEAADNTERHRAKVEHRTRHTD